MNAALAHVRSLWGRWWPLPAAIPISFYAVIYAIGDLRGEHVFLTLVAIVLAYTGPRTKRLFVALLPLVVTGASYDLVKYARPIFVRPERVLGCGLRATELMFFRVGPDTTFPDLFQRWHVPALDLFCSIPYAGYLYVAGATGVYLYFKDQPRMRHYLWSFAVANLLSYTIWMVLPAAPPWYLHAHGCTIDMSVRPNPAGLARVDALLGINYFGAFYTRAASVFGAMPSMHCGYPMLGLFTAWRVAGWKARSLHVFYAMWMFFSAIYLDHHWVLDALAGWTVVAIAVTITGYVLRRREAQPISGAGAV
ncbi:PAP2 family protein [Minicystis rosea]|nr:PAP2 family protein [Minicystis rosea]